MEGSSCIYFYLLTFLLISSCVNPISATRPTPKSTNTEFIKTSCGCTTYPTLCYSSLADQATLIQTSPKRMAHAALNVTLATTKSTFSVMVNLSKSLGMKHGEMEAMKDCLEELKDSVYEVKRSLGEMGRIKDSNKFRFMMSNIQTWVSAALTDESTCCDGFEANTENGKVVRGKVVNVAHMTSNALALINHYVSLHG